MTDRRVPQTDATQSHARSVHLVIPSGTQVVARVELRDAAGVVICPRGATGVVTRAPDDGTHAYRVRLPDGREVALKREQLTIRKHVQGEDLERVAAGTAEHDLREFVIYRCVLGSHAYGLAHEHSDVDRRGIYLPPAALHWSLFGVPEQLEDRETDEVYWEMRKFVTLALKANPNILECLYTPLVEHAAPLAEELLAMRGAFLSRQIYQTYNGYVLSQFKRLEADLRTVGAIKWKHAMHLVRLLLAGITGLREGVIPVRVEEHRERLLSIKRGEESWEEVNTWRLALHAELDAALERSPLPEQPDYEAANAFLVRARRSMVR